MPIVDWAQLILPHSSTNCSPYELTHARSPRTTLDWHPTSAPANAKESLDREEATHLVNKLKAGLEFARTEMTKSQQIMKINFDKHHRVPDFDVGDYVWITTKHWNTARPNKKLDHKMAGPYKILVKEGHSFRLELPESLGLKHPVFHASKLRKAAMDPLPGQRNEPPPPIELIPGDQEWEVESILDCKKHHNRLRYRVEWSGHDDDPEWYPAANLKYSPALLRDYHRKHPEKPGPPANLTKWAKAYHDGLEDYEYLAGNDKEMSPAAKKAFFTEVNFAGSSHRQNA